MFGCCAMWLSASCVIAAAPAAAAPHRSANRQAAQQARGDVLPAGGFLRPGQKRVSRNHRYILIMQKDGNLVLYRARRRHEVAMWSSQTGGQPGAFAAMQADGNLVVYARSHGAIYASGTSGRQLFLVVQNDGNAVIYTREGHAVWASKQDVVQLSPNQSLHSGQARRSANGQYILGMQPDGNLVLYGPGNHAIWSSQTSGHPGAWTAIEPSGVLVVLDSTGRHQLYTSGDGAAVTDGRLDVQNDGNTVIYVGQQTPIWWTNEDTSRLTTGQYLLPGQFRASPDGAYTLTMQDDGNLVLYRTATQKPLWASYTASPGAFAAMQDDGNLVIYSAADQPLFATYTAGGRGSHLDVQADGNLVVYSPAAAALWNTGT